MKLDMRIVKLLIVILLAYLGLRFSIVMHEVAHAEIFKGYGFKPEITIGLLSGYTTAYGNATCTDDCQMLHSLNELVFCAESALIFNLWMVVLALALLLRGG